MADQTAAPPARRQVILLVDDEPDIRESLKALFETCLADVEVRATGAAEPAVEILGDGPIDVIISDYRLPGMDGLAFLAAAAQRHPTTPRILVTAFPELDIAIRAINEANIENFFTKPLEADAIVTIVRTLLHEGRVREARSLSLARAPGSR